MKVSKGRPGYIEAHKKKTIIQSAIAFSLVAAILILGYVQTGTKLNMLTMVAILGCLPAAKLLVAAITIFPHHSIEKKMADEIAQNAVHLTSIYDMVITSYEKIMPVNCIVIMNQTICGYTGSKKVDPVYAANHVKQILNQNQFTKVSVKLFTDYTAFLIRVKEMNQVADADGIDTSELEERMKQVILNISI